MLDGTVTVVTVFPTSHCTLYANVEGESRREGGCVAETDVTTPVHHFDSLASEALRVSNSQSCCILLPTSSAPTRGKRLSRSMSESRMLSPPARCVACVVGHGDGGAMRESQMLS